MSKKNKISETTKNGISFFVVTFLAVLLTYIFTQTVAFMAYIPSESMCNTLKVGDRVIASRISYVNDKEPKRGDIVLFHTNEMNNSDYTYIKRVIGEPGDKIEIKNGIVYVNSKKLDEDYAVIDNYSGTFEVPEGCYFVMGDNRGNSLDARYWNNHYLKRKDIYAKALFKIYPKIVNL